MASTGCCCFGPNGAWAALSSFRTLIRNTPECCFFCQEGDCQAAFSSELILRRTFPFLRNRVLSWQSPASSQPVEKVPVAFASGAVTLQAALPASSVWMRVRWPFSLSFLRAFNVLVLGWFMLEQSASACHLSEFPFFILCWKCFSERFGGRIRESRICCVTVSFTWRFCGVLVLPFFFLEATWVDPSLS